MTWAKWLFQSSREVQGTKVDAHIAAIAKLKGEAPKELYPEPELPAMARYVVQLFLELSSTRQSGMGAGPITYVEIKAMCELLGIQLEPWEVDGIRLLDRTLLQEIDKGSAK